MHTPTPWDLQSMGPHEYDVWCKERGHFGVFLGINAGNGAPDQLDADDQREFEDNVRLVFAAAQSYASAFGPAAVAAAERDALASMKALLIKLLTWVPTDDAIAQLREEVSDLLARIPGGEGGGA